MRQKNERLSLYVQKEAKVQSFASFVKNTIQMVAIWRRSRSFEVLILSMPQSSHFNAF